MPEHEHVWKMLMHLDLCHGYTSSYQCECGATRAIYGERSTDGYGMVWMDPDNCDRCKALVGGAEPEHDDQFFPPDA